jgi:hypothetical protein
MDAIKTTQYARALMQAHGPRAIATAAQRQRENETRGNRHEAENWRRIRDALTEMRGPAQG